MPGTQQSSNLSLNMRVHLNRLKRILRESDEKYLFPCIEDLVTNGLNSARFSSEDHRPSRQDITQYLAAWFRHIGICADDCRDWMIEYCVDLLSTISCSSNSQIRHSTKSNIKYIYKSDVSFECGCENNIFKASCDRNCPVYEEMSDKYKERKAREAKRSYEPEPIHHEEQIETLSVKQKYRDQFEKALEVVQDQIKKGLAIPDIVVLLNDRGFKTRTGRKWTYSVLQTEAKGHHFEPEPKDNEVGLQRFSIKDKYSAQFEKALEIAINHVEKGVSKQHIITLLNDRGFKTRTGRKWTYSILQSELKKCHLCG